MITRRALLDAAMELIDEAGTADISLGEVAMAAGVGRTTFYEYFSDRDDLIAALVEEKLPDVVSRLIESVPDDLPVGEQLAELAMRTVEFVATDLVLGVILHREAGRMGADAQARIKESHSELSSEMARLYRRGVEEGVFAEMSPVLAGTLIQDTIMAGARVVIGGDGNGLAEVLDGVRRYLLGGLGYREFNHG